MLVRLKTVKVFTEEVEEQREAKAAGSRDSPVGGMQASTDSWMEKRSETTGDAASERVAIWAKGRSKAVIVRSEVNNFE